MAKISMNAQTQAYYSKKEKDLKSSLITTAVGAGLIAGAFALNAMAYQTYTLEAGYALWGAGIISANIGLGIAVGSAISYATSQIQNKKELKKAEEVRQEL